MGARVTDRRNNSVAFEPASEPELPLEAEGGQVLVVAVSLLVGLTAFVIFVGLVIFLGGQSLRLWAACEHYKGCAWVLRKMQPPNKYSPNDPIHKGESSVPPPPASAAPRVRARLLASDQPDPPEPGGAEVADVEAPAAVEDAKNGEPGGDGSNSGGEAPATDADGGGVATGQDSTPTVPPRDMPPDTGSPKRGQAWGP